MLSTSTFTNVSPATQRIAFGILTVVAFGLYFGLQLLGHPLVAVGAFVVFFGGAIALVAGSSSTLFDERDRRHHDYAAGQTVTLYGWLCAVGFPTFIVLEAFDQVSIPEWLAPISVAVIVFYLTYVAFQFVSRWRA